MTLFRLVIKGAKVPTALRQLSDCPQLAFLHRSPADRERDHAGPTGLVQDFNDVAFEVVVDRVVRAVIDDHTRRFAKSWKLARPALRKLRANAVECLAQNARDQPRFRTTRIRASGPEVVLTSDLAQALALIIHELGTNAAKYGALSASNGFVTIDWDVAEANVSLTWTERGGPAIPPPSKPGFGTTLITSLLKPLNGSAKMDFQPTGLVCHVSFSLKAE